MKLNYSTLPFDVDGNPITPTLMLKTLGERKIGVLAGVYNLSFNVKFVERSEMEFDIPAKLTDADGRLITNPLYKQVTGAKMIWTEHYGIYITMNPQITKTAFQEVKHVKAYSLETEMSSKILGLPEGTYRFYNPLDPQDANTFMGRVLEIVPNWKIGTVSSNLYDRYRTFPSTSSYLLDFLYNNAMKSYQCLFVFDPYERTIDILDANEETVGIPVYLSFDNLLTEYDEEDKTDELVTAVRPSGADDLNILAVNPTGEAWIYDLSHFIANGDLGPDLAAKWIAWNQKVQNAKPAYSLLTARRATIRMETTSIEADLADLQSRLTALTTVQSTIIAGIARGLETESRLAEQNALIRAKQAEVNSKEAELLVLQDEIDQLNTEISALVDSLRMTNTDNFTVDELRELRAYFIQQDVSEESFVASDINTNTDVSSVRVSSITLTIAECNPEQADTSVGSVVSMRGGRCRSSGPTTFGFTIDRATLESRDDGTFLLSAFTGSFIYGQIAALSGTVTLNGTGSVSIVDSTVTLTVAQGTMYFTTGVTEYQRYSVQNDLYDYGVTILDQYATPTFEFSIDSGNFLFEQNFAPFRSQLDLGRHIYLNNGDEILTPYLIEMRFSFESREQLELIFSHRFKRQDNVNTLKDMIEQSYSSGRSFDLGQLSYNQTVKQASAVSKFMSDSLDAAVNAVIGGANQDVVIDGSGIHITSADSDEEIRIVNSMIAMSDDHFNTAHLALGRFQLENGASYFGINADVVGGKLIVGNSLVIENVSDRGVTQFRVDQAGAWINNGMIVMQQDGGGKMVLDPTIGLLGGTNRLFTTDGTTLAYPAGFQNASGQLILDSDGMPKNTNFFLDIKTGKAYFRGTIIAESGHINNELIAGEGEFSGTIRSSVIEASEIYATEIHASNLGSGIELDEILQVNAGGNTFYLGPAYGFDGQSQTYGVALSNSPDINSADNYVIITNAGARLQSFGSSISVSKRGCWVEGEFFQFNGNNVVTQ